MARATQAVGHSRVDYCGDWDVVRQRLGELGPGDVVLTMGAGDVYRFAERLSAEEGVSRELLGSRRACAAVPPPASAVRCGGGNPWLAIGRHFAQALVMVGGPTAVALWLFTSPTFALGAVEFGPHPHVSDVWVNEALAPLVGKNLFRLEGARRPRPDRRASWVDRVTVGEAPAQSTGPTSSSAVLVALFHDGATLSYLDGKGRVIAPYDPEHGPRGPAAHLEEQPVRNRSCEAFALSHELEAAEYLAGAFRGPCRRSSEGAETSASIRACGRSRRWSGGGHRRSWARLESVRTLLPDLERRYGGVAFIDLRFDRRIVFQPAPRERTGEWPKQNSTS
ncbi:MAG: hypothetical protein R2862_05940 [Thermoanaerobaculia bacterium]